MKEKRSRLTSAGNRRGALLAALALAFCTELCGKPAPPVATPFSFTDQSAKSVCLAGEFNHWSTTATPLERDAAGKWSATVPLRPGRYGYKFIVDGRWLVDPANPEQAPDGFGGKNSILVVSDPFADPVVEEKAAVDAEAARLFKEKNFAALEKMAGALRRDQVRFSDGLWKLVEFYNGLRAARQWSDESDREAWFDRLEEWHRAFPQSITQPVVLADGWIGYAWNARGAGLAKTVTQEGWRLFGERLAKARAVLEAAPRERCPSWYGAMQAVAQGEGWKRDDYFALFNEAARANPTFYNYYWDAASYLLPRWFGSEGEWESFAEAAAKEFDPEEGLAVYTRTAWSKSTDFSNLFDESAITWPKMKQGFLDIEKQYPNSRWNLSAFCRFAFLANDRETVNALLKRIGEHGDATWSGYARFELAKQWADPATPLWRIEPRLTLQKEGHSREPIYAVAFSPDGKWIAGGGGEEGWVAIWSAATGEEVWSEEVSGDPVLSIAFSPNGKLLAAGAGEANFVTHSGVVKIWDLPTKELCLAREAWGSVWHIAFAPDGATLGLGGGWYDEQAEAALLEIPTENLRSLPWTKGHDHGLRGLAISPDGKALAADCYQSISVWSLAENKMLFDKRNTLSTFARALAFSPDGKTLAVGGMPVSAHSDTEPGGLTLWETRAWKQVTPRAQEDAAGIATVAWSPNGKWIVGGGQDQSVHVWDAAALQSKTIYLAHDGMIWSVAFSPDGRTIASASNNGLIKLWKFP